MLEINKIYLGNNKDLLKQIDNEFIDLIITSPPYKEEDGYNPILFQEVFRELYRVLKPNSLFFLNFGHLAEDKFRPFRVCGQAISEGFLLNDTIIWKKTQFSPIQGKKRLNNLTEFIFLFFKGKMPDLNRLSIGVPYKDKSNIGRYSDKDLRCQGNFWEFGYETIQSRLQKLHHDRFPLELPLRCIKLANLEMDAIVLDPFAGSFTTCVAAKKLGFNYMGIEKELKYYEIGGKRLCK